MNTPSSQNKGLTLRIVFFGTPDFAVPSIQKLIENSYNIVAVVTQPDSKKNKESRPSPSPIKQLATQHSIPVLQPERIDDKTIEQLRKLKPDIFIVVAYGHILPAKALELPGFGSINVHASLLPKYRGPSPIQNALLDGQSTTGTTIMLLNQGMDTGPILKQRAIDIAPDEKADILTQRLSLEGAELLLETLPLWALRDITPQEQENNEATYCQLIEKDDGHIFWNETAQSIYDKFRAFFPWPGIYSYWKRAKDTRRIKFIDIEIQTTQPETPHHAGEVFQIADTVGIQTSQGIILPKQIQIEGKNVQNIEEFLRGHSDFLGSVLQ